MARKRAEQKHTKKSLFSKSSFRYGFVGIIIIFVVILGCIFVLTTEDANNSDPSTTEDTNNFDQPGKWLFAMDTDNIQYKYGASGIPTLAIIDKNGNVAYYNQGVHSKDQLMPYITSAIEGTAESWGAAPDFTVDTFNNEVFTLSEHQGEVILLDIMGVGCPPCEIQMPELQKIKQEMGEEITILSVDVRYSGETAKDVMDTYGEYIKT